LSVKYPSLYLPGQKGILFNRKEFLFSVMHGIVSSLVLFFIPYGTMYHSVMWDGKEAADLQSFGFAVATILVIVVNFQVNNLIKMKEKAINFNFCLFVYKVWLGYIILDWF
jgi:phospholipid-translocating ATPase